MGMLRNAWNKLCANLGTNKASGKSPRRCHQGRQLRFEAMEDHRMLAAVTVTTNLDVVDGNVSSISSLVANKGADGDISLREAVQAANADTTADTITFDSTLNGGRLTLSPAPATARLRSPTL